MFGGGWSHGKCIPLLGRRCETPTLSGTKISQNGTLAVIAYAYWGPTPRAKKFTATKLFICCFGDITKDYGPKILNIAPSGEP